MSAYQSKHKGSTIDDAVDLVNDSSKGNEVLQTNLSKEIQERKEQDATLQNNIDKEIQERKEQDATLQNNIDTLTKQVETFHPTITDKSMTHLIYENMLNYYMPIEITEDDSNTFAYDNLIVNSGVLQYLCENNKITFADSVTSSMGLFLMSDIRETFSDLNINNVTKVSGWFALCYNLVSVKEPTHNNTITDFNGLCFDCFNLLDIDWNMDGATDLGSAFYNCERLQATPSGDLTECYNLENAFKGCKSLETFNFTNIGCSFDLSDCVKLSHDTLVSIISTLQTTTNSPTLTLGTTLKSLLNDSEIKVATDKGWTIE